MRRPYSLFGRAIQIVLFLVLGLFSASYPAPVETRASGPIFQEPGRGECDLTIRSAQAVDFLPGSVIVIFHVEVANQGEAPSPPVALTVHDEDNQVSGSARIESIPPGESRGMEVRLKAPDSWWDSVHSFIVVLDPDNTAPESNRENNTFFLGSVSIPSAPGPGPAPHPDAGPNPGPRPGPNLFTLILIAMGAGILGVGVLGGGGFLLQSSIKAGERKQWEKQARPGQPPDDCQPSRHHCEVKNEIDLKPMRVTQLDVVVADADSEHVRRRQTIKGQLAAGLQMIIFSHWLGEPTDRLAARIEDLAQELSRTFIHLLQSDQVLCNLTISAHLEGIEVISTFTLYRCVGTPPETSWKKIARWEVKKQQERDDLVVMLSGKRGSDTSLPVRLPTELFPQLRDYVDRY